ncbi:hypothetical protein Tco_1168846 [Tanacetum coccineum]
MAHMALSDSEVKTCSKTCLKNHETLKTQYDKLRIKHNKTEFDLANYKRALASVEEQLAFYKNNEKLKKDKEDNLIKIEKYDNASKSLDKLIGSLVVDNSKKGLGYNATPPPLTGLFAPPTIDLSHSGIEKFKEPEFVGYGVKVDKIVSENSSVEIKKILDAPIIKDWVLDDEEQDESKPKSEKKTVIPTIKKIEFVKAKQDDKTVRNTVKYAEMYRSQRPRGNQRNWNNQKSQKLGSNPETKLKDLVRLNCLKDEKREGAELTQQNDKSQYKKLHGKLMLIEKITSEVNAAAEINAD